MSAIVLSSETPEATQAFYDAHQGRTAEPAAKAVVESQTEPAAAKPATEGKSSKPQEQATPHPDDPPAVDAEGKPSKVHVRFSELSAQRIAAEEAKAKAEADLTAERQARALAEQQATELRNKYEPPKTEADPKPTRSQFANDGEYEAAFEEWTTDKVKRETAVQERRGKTQQAWMERETDLKSEFPDYDEAIAKGSTLKIPNGVIDAIASSEYGPRIAYELAKDPDMVAKLSGMGLDDGLRFIGKLEGKFEAVQAAKTAPAVVEKLAPAAAAPQKPAPAPITPIKAGTAAAANDLPLDASGAWHGTAAQWRAAREAGKIK